MKGQQKRNWTKGKSYQMPNGDVLHHEMDEIGFHRLILNGTEAGFSAPYNAICSIINMKTGARYIAVSAFYDGHLPIEQPILLTTGVRCDCG